PLRLCAARSHGIEAALQTTPATKVPRNNSVAPSATSLTDTSAVDPAHANTSSPMPARSSFLFTVRIYLNVYVWGRARIRRPVSTTIANSPAAMDGVNTSHHDQSITPVNFSTTKMRVRISVNPILRSYSGIPDARSPQQSALQHFFAQRHVL